MSGLRVASDPLRFAGAMALYREVRVREGRWLDVDAVRRLPAVDGASPLASEWRVRAWTAEVLLRHLAGARRVLELGCGNGWLSALLARRLHAEVVGLDVNRDELELAAAAFADVPGLSFCLGDVFEDGVAEPPFDAVVAAASIQYFPDLGSLLGRLGALLRPRGEVVIADSPLYEPAGLEPARERSRAHYARLGVPAMAEHYHHHLAAALPEARYLHRPGALSSRLRRGLGQPVSPFPVVVVPRSRLLGA